MKKFAIFLTVGVSALAVSANAATPIAGSMFLRADASMGDGSFTDFNFTGSSWANVPISLVTGVTATATDGINDTITVQGFGNSGWSGANAGGISFEGYGWSFNAAGNPGQSAFLNDHSGGDDWSYTFVATGNGQFSMNYSVFAGGNTFGLQGWDIFVDGNLAAPLTDSFDPTASGVFNLALVNGQQYTVSLRNNANISTSGSLLDYSGDMNGNFRWLIAESAVPEPASWALMIAGFGLVGSAMRRRRETVRVSFG